MNTIIYRLKEFRPTLTLNELARQMGLHPEQVRRCTWDYTDEQKKILHEYIDSRIRELVKIKVLLDKEVQGQ